MTKVTNKRLAAWSKGGRIFLRFVLWLLFSLLMLALLLFLFFRIPSLRKLATDKAMSYLSAKTGGNFELRDLSLQPDGVRISGLSVYTPGGDTLLYLRSLKVGLNIWKLFSRQVVLEEISLKGVVTGISRAEGDTLFNFSFITQAFNPQNPAAGPSDTGSVWKIDPRRLDLEDIDLRYRDSPGGISAGIRLQKLEMDLQGSDLSRARIHLRSLNLSGARILVETKPALLPEENQEEKRILPALQVDEVTIKNTTFKYNDHAGASSLAAQIGKFNLKPRLTDLNELRFKIDELSLFNSSVSYGRGQALNKNSSQYEDNEDQILRWQVEIRKTDLRNNSAAYNDERVPARPSGLDPAHLFISGLHLEAGPISLSPSNYSLSLHDLGFVEKSGFAVRSFKSDILFSDKELSLTGLDLVTDNCRIGDRLRLAYDSLPALAAAAFTVDLRLRDTRLGLSDLRYFAPQLFNDSMLKKQASAVLELNAGLRGSAADLFIEELSVAAGSSVLDVKGRLKNMMHVAEGYAALDTVELKLFYADLTAMLGPQMLPAAVRIPDTLSLRAALRGYLKNFDARLDLRTSMGNAFAVILMDPDSGKKESSYTATLSVENLEAGRILRQPEPGRLSLEVRIEGAGFDTSDLDAGLTLALKEAVYKKYAYHDLVFNGRLRKQSLTGRAEMKDANLSFLFDGHLNMDASQPELDFSLNLRGADLKALHLSDDGLKLSTSLQADLVLPKGRNPEGMAALYNLNMVKEDKKYHVDSLVFRSAAQEDGLSALQLNSDFLNASLNGRVSLAEIVPSLLQHFNSVFRFRAARGDTVGMPQDYSFTMELRDPGILTSGLVPGLNKLMPLKIEAKFNSTARQFGLSANMPLLVYKNTEIDSFRLKLNADGNHIDYALNVAQIVDSTILLENFYLGGVAKDNRLGFTLGASRDDSVKLVSVKGELISKYPSYELSLQKDLVLNTESWRLDSAHVLRFSPGGFFARSFNLHREGQSLLLNTGGSDAGAPLGLAFRDFNLLTLSRLIDNKRELLSGSLNGEVVLESQDGVSAFRSDLAIRQFAFHGKQLGDLSLKADNFEDPKKYDLNLVLKGEGNDLHLAGHYTAEQPAGRMNLDLQMTRLDLSGLDHFLTGKLSRLSGSLSGNLNVRGPLNSPDFKGKLELRETAFEPAILGSYLRVPAGELVFSGKQVKLNNFIMYDTLQKEASLAGEIDLSDLSDPSFNLRVRSGDFLVMNTSKQDNPLYYGRVFLDSDLKIKGPVSQPEVDVKAGLNKGSVITYVKPETESGKNESRGVVEFTDSLAAHEKIMTREDTAARVKGMEGLELNAALNVDRDVEVRVIVDPLAGDSLYLRGGGLLNLSLDRAGNTGLTGKYNITEGGYFLSINNIVKRSFQLRKGSSVTWSGDPLDAYMDLTAVYLIKASPLDLMQDELAGLAETDLNKYRNLLDFEVHLRMNGFLSSPSISFDIQLAPGERGSLNGTVDAKLAELRGDESQLNKQVFALLTLKRFIGENPLESSSGGGLSSAGRSSASKVLTQQLNSLSDKYVEFVDLDLGVNSYEDYSTGQQEGRTQLQLGVSKQFLNDRVTVKVGGNVELEGERARQNNANDVAGNISVDYSLTEDGRYKLKAFRENQYENPIEGELTKTGAGVVFTRDFNKFKNLFKKPGKYREKKKKQ